MVEATRLGFAQHRSHERPCRFLSFMKRLRVAQLADLCDMVGAVLKELKQIPRASRRKGSSGLRRPEQYLASVRRAELSSVPCLRWSDCRAREEMVISSAELRMRLRNPRRRVRPTRGSKGSRRVALLSHRKGCASWRSLLGLPGPQKPMRPSEGSAFGKDCRKPRARSSHWGNLSLGLLGYARSGYRAPVDHGPVCPRQRNDNARPPARTEWTARDATQRAR